MELKSRAEMDPRYTWDLTPIYENDEAWGAELAAAAETVKALSALPGTLSDSVEDMKSGLEAVFRLLP